MMEWKEYISGILLTNQELGELSISIDGGITQTKIPPLINASIAMLDKMIERKGNRNVFVFPEGVQSIFIFIMMKLFHNITMGKIQSNYDPSVFSCGDKLKVGNAIVEYLGTENRDGDICLMLKLADVDILSAPIGICPIFQKVETKRKLSKYAQYIKAKKIAIASLPDNTQSNELLSYIASMKTHMDSSLYVMTPIASVKDQLANFYIGKQRATDVYYIAQIHVDGTISNISPGQMKGNPAIVFASDLYAIRTAVETQRPIQSVIIDGSHSSTLLNQMDALDELLQLEIPVLLITDTVNSFDLYPLKERGANIWRWDRDNLIDQLYNSTSVALEKKAKNCAKQEIQYLHVEDNLIDEAMQKLSSHRKETETQSIQMIRVFEKLNNLTFSVLRSVTPISATDASLSQRTLDECKTVLKLEKPFIDPNIMEDYNRVIGVLESIYSDAVAVCRKSIILGQYLDNHRFEKIILVVPEKANKSAIQNYWDKWCAQNTYHNQVKVLYPTEYYATPTDTFDTTIICGWLKRAIMKKIIYSFITTKIEIILYGCEKKWKNHDTHKWAKIINDSGNKLLVENVFSTEEISVSTEQFVDSEADPMSESVDELGEIELILRENRLRQYVGKNNSQGSDMVTAIPISYVGGFLAFYRQGHKLLSATRIITSESEAIEQKLPAELSVGDFTIVREADKDIIRELADIALNNSGKAGIREEAVRWREALKIELLFESTNELYMRLKEAGCNKGFATVKRWIDDEDVIAPQSKEDLRIIAKVTENEVLNEKLDAIFEAAQDVRSAHILAGRKLSEQLKHKLAVEIRKYGEIDPYNFWEPIDLDIEGIGTVKVLKIIDIGSAVEVDSSLTNHLIEE